MGKRIAVLALQGAFEEHVARLRALGAEAREVRQLADWEAGARWDGLVLPGGESTAQRRLLHELGLYAPLRRAVAEEGLPVLGTCAGLILLARSVEGDAPGMERFPTLGTLDVTACRNAYGRQLGSFRTVAPCRLPGAGEAPTSGSETLTEAVGASVSGETLTEAATASISGETLTEAATASVELPMTFIRAPYVAEAGPGVEVLASVGERIVAVRQGRQLAVAFHPELDADVRLHDCFLRSVCR